MILVTLGTQDKPFTRLLETIEQEIILGHIKEEVVVQAGYTKYETDKMKIYDLLPMEEFDKLIKKCRILITHGGVGSIIKGLKANKIVIAAPRLEKYGEHTNDHQKQIVNNFSAAGYILALNDFSKLKETLEKAEKFKPNKFTSNTSNMIELIEDYIKKELNK